MEWAGAWTAEHPIGEPERVDDEPKSEGSDSRSTVCIVSLERPRRRPPRGFLSVAARAQGGMFMTSTQTFPVGGLPLLRSLAENWWLLLLRGIAAVAFGILAIIWPGHTLLALIYLYGAYALVDGIFALGAAIFGHSGGMVPRWWLAVIGVIGILAGLVAFALPGMTAVILLLLIASWAIIVGVLEVIGAIRLRKEIEGEWWLIISGLLSIAFGVILFVRPGSGALALIWVIAIYAILAGASLIGHAFRLKNFKQSA